MTNPRLAREGLSNSIMEYMALGLPVVCGDGGGNPELVLDGVTGFIVPPNDPGALAERLQYLRDHEAERRVMGAAGKARILGEFSVETMVDRMLRVYTEAMEGRP
jgi:glycosyltransferase involved in cell wall biosynthesis